MRKNIFSSLFIIIMTLMVVFSSTAFAVHDSEQGESTSQVSSITLTSLGEGDLSWGVVGTSVKGFKVIWSLNSGATYPTREGDKYQYFTEPTVTTATVTAFDGGGTYYVRVCEYLGGVCGTYSNEVEVYFEGELKTTAPEKFEDVDDSHENADAIEYLKDEGVVVGYADDTYKPESSINRAEFLKIVMEVSGYSPAGSNCYLDVKEQWFAMYVCKATTLGIVNGYDDGTFKPETYINFAEASKIIVNVLLIQVDDSLDTQWFQRFVVALENLAAIPTSVASFDDDVTRGEMAEMIYRVKTENTYKESKSYGDLEKETEGEIEDPLDEDKLTGDVTTITLVDKGDAKVGWQANGYSDMGFKIVWSKTSGPTYPTRSGDQYIFLTDPSATTTALNAFDGTGTYYVRVCEYLGGTCGVYSNEITVDLMGDEVEEGDVIGLILSAGTEGAVSWEVEGVSELGFKVVWSKTSLPTYPLRTGDQYLYYDEEDATEGVVTPFDGVGTYYVRVCEYLGGSCGYYSNEVVVTL